ncbi:putative siderophore biosynthesis protein [Erysiphe necator]|uniref:Putative siderophore biosynthesis protein n=1 Tax=Uncinula necator TaxID=52586 RepID=A0A0B1P0S2_UNCNE|nr:putative siderophore biosynthesis protein [Erysiphe necator]
MSESTLLPRSSASKSSTNHVRLPNGQSLTVRPVFGGFLFKPDELNVQNSTFPAAWTVILQTEDIIQEDGFSSDHVDQKPDEILEKKARYTHPYRRPTLQSDSLFISSISNPSSHDFSTQNSSSRQIVMMLWTSLYWYFHQEEPSPFLLCNTSKITSETEKIRGDWRINIKPEGILRGRHLIQKLERMGLVTSKDSSVGLEPPEKMVKCWSNTFTSRRAFWQIPAKYFLKYTTNSPGLLLSSTPYASRPNSPVFGEPKTTSPISLEFVDSHSRHSSQGLTSQFSIGSLSSESQYFIYYPPVPLQYTTSSGIQHPLRSKPPGQGEIFYTRFIPSFGQFLSFRTASLSEKPVPYKGPTSDPKSLSHHSKNSLPSATLPVVLSPTIQTPSSIHSNFSLSPFPSPVPLHLVDDGLPSNLLKLMCTSRMTDCQLLHRWMNIPRVSKFWGCDGPILHQEEFLQKNLEAQHSFPVIGLWDGKPFGYFEIYWAKEDILGRHINDGSIGDWDRGIHVLVGEDEFRGKHRVKCWLTALAHWVFSEDYRTNSLVLEPRVDNEKFISYLQESGFLKEREVSFPHKKSKLMRLRRDQFEAPML